MKRMILLEAERDSFNNVFHLDLYRLQMVLNATFSHSPPALYYMKKAGATHGAIILSNILDKEEVLNGIERNFICFELL